MIIDKHVEVKIGSANYSIYKKLGYDVKMNEIFLINIKDLTKGSKTKVNCKCDYCGDITNIIYCNYINQIKKNLTYSCSHCTYKKAAETNLKTIGVEYYAQLKEDQERKKKTCLEKYGVDSFFKTNEYKQKFENTCLDKYGVKNPFQSSEIIDKIKNTNISNGNWSKSNECYALYRRKVYHETSKNKLKLLENWDGHDYYDNEFILDNFHLNHNNNKYPTIDHKISVLYGYENNISIIEISDISNLCITKKSINSSKGKKSIF